MSGSKLKDLTWSLDIKESLNPLTREDQNKSVKSKNKVKIKNKCKIILTNMTLKQKLCFCINIIKLIDIILKNGLSRK